MVEGKQGAMVRLKKDQNPITEFQKFFQGVVNPWLTKQFLPMEAAAATLGGAARGAALGALIGTVTPKGLLIQARSHAVSSCVNDCISCVMKRIKGKEDIESSIAAGFGSGVMFSLAEGMGGPNQAADAITTGLTFALVQAGFFKFREKPTNPPAEDVLYSKTKSMLTKLGLQNYKKNFQKGLLTDTTLPLLTDSALKDARIPPGPRLLILDHIQRETDLKKAEDAETLKQSKMTNSQLSCGRIIKFIM